MSMCRENLGDRDFASKRADTSFSGGERFSGSRTVWCLRDGAHRGFVFKILKCQKNKALAIKVAQTKNFSEGKLS